MNKNKIEKKNLIHDVKLTSLPIYQDEESKLIKMIKREMSVFKGLVKFIFLYEFWSNKRLVYAKEKLF